jgi:hypothetical protein
MQAPGGHVRRRGKAKKMGEGDPTALCDEADGGACMSSQYSFSPEAANNWSDIVSEASCNVRVDK